MDDVLVSAGIQFIFTRDWEQTQPGQLTQTSQRGYSIPCDIMLSVQLGELAKGLESLPGDGLGIGFLGGENIALCITCFL